MKKVILLTAASLVIANSMMAQEFNDAKNSVEIGFNPFSNDFETFRIDELKYRRFFGNSAVRVRLGFGLSSTKTTTNKNNGTFDPVITPEPTSNYNSTTSSNSYEESITTTKRNNFNIFLGYEYHFIVSRHMNVYVGAELGYEMEGGSEKVETTGHESESSSRTSTYSSGYPSYTQTSVYRTNKERNYASLYETKKKDAFGAFAVGIFTGVDVNIYKGLYLGAELGLQFKKKSFKEPEVTNSGSSSTVETSYSKEGSNNATNKARYMDMSWNTASDGLKTTTTVTHGDDMEYKTQTDKTLSLYKAKTSSTDFKLYASPALRIGWRF